MEKNTKLILREYLFNFVTYREYYLRVSPGIVSKVHNCLISKPKIIMQAYNKKCASCGQNLSECKTCSGKGKYISECDWCGGRCDVHCNYCRGTRVDDRGRTCLGCHGTGLVECRHCNGKGRLIYRCEKCNGSGLECKSCDDVALKKREEVNRAQKKEQKEDDLRFRFIAQAVVCIPILGSALFFDAKFVDAMMLYFVLLFGGLLLNQVKNKIGFWMLILFGLSNLKTFSGSVNTFLSLLTFILIAIIANTPNSENE